MEVVLVAALVAVAVVYRRQLARRLLRRRGRPRVTTPWVPPLGGAPVDLHLAVVGDVGTPNRTLRATGAALAAVDARLPFDGLVVLGDNVYQHGDPAGLTATVFDPFAPLLAHADLHAILGNHDVRRGNAAGQVAALGMPGRWWARHLAGDVLLVGLDSTQGRDPAQRAWLDRTLGAATERWRVVAVHHPPFSVGYQGADRRTRQAFTPLFAAHGVALVLSGHDHDYQRSDPVDGVTYVVTGGAARPRRTGAGPPMAVTHGAWGHAVELAVAGDRLALRAVGTDGRVADDVVLTPPPRPPGPPG